MKIKIFGKELFEIGRSSKGALLYEAASSGVRESKYLPDFMEMTANHNPMDQIITLQQIGTVTAKGEVEVDKKEEKPKKTPKEMYQLKLLHDGSFELNTNEEYLNSQIEDFKEKLSLVSNEEYDMRRGVVELSSIVLRLENRRKYAEVKSYFEEYPYTTTSKVDDVLKDNDHLKMGQIAQFVADLPPEAIKVMKKYNEGTKKLCGKQAVFYIIANKKDFEKSNKRRDPILLAQSPFAHVWQILGAWDEEMMLLESL